MVPQPEDMFHGNLGEKERKECEEKGIPNWYDWNIANWGVKWDVADVESERYDAHLTLCYDTPWGPPDGIKSALKDMFEEAAISWFYDEPMMELAGYLK